MSNAAHTPTPWHVVNGNQIKDELMPFDRDERDTVLIATTGPRAESELAKSNAAFIVRAVNSHEQLVTALRDLFDSYKRLADSGDCGNWSVEDLDEGKAALAALAAAEA